MDIEHTLLQRISKVNNFIDLPNYKDTVLKAVGDILSFEIWESFNKKRVFPDPNGEFTIVFTNSQYQVNMTIRGVDNIDCSIIRTQSGTYIGEMFTSNVQEVKKFCLDEVSLKR